MVCKRVQRQLFTVDTAFRGVGWFQRRQSGDSRIEENLSVAGALQADPAGEANSVTQPP